MTLRFLLAPLAALLPCAALAQTGSVGIGTTAPAPSAALEIRSTSQGLLLPRLTLAQRDALTASTTAPPVPGLLVYLTDGTPGLYAYDGTAWVRLGADNLGNHLATQPLDLAANPLVGNGGSTGLTISSGGNVGLGTTAAQPATQRLDVRGNLRLGTDGGSSATGTGQAIEFVGPGVNTDPVGLYRVNPASDQSELRVVVGDVADATDRFSVGRMGGTSSEGGIPTGSFTPHFTVRSDGNVGVGTTAPAAALDVNGALVLEETASSSLTGNNPAFAIPANVSSVRLVPGTTAPTGTVALTSTGPVVGQRLSVFNGTTIDAQLGGNTIRAGQLGQLVYSNGDWRGPGVATGSGDNLGNHTATQNLNLNGNKLVGGTTARAGQGGLALDGNGLLSLGAARLDSTTTYGARLLGMDQDVVLTSKSTLNPTVGGTRTLPVTGVGDRVMWLSYYSAFRAGGVSGNGTFNTGSTFPRSIQWDNPFIGRYSVAFGLDNAAGDQYSAIFGNNNVLRAGIGSFATGNGNNGVQTYYGLMMGTQNAMRGQNGLVGGYQSKVQTNPNLPTPSLAFGYRAQARTFQSGCVALGYYARTGGFEGSFTLADYSPVRTDYVNDSLVSTAFNQFSARFAGGYRLFTTTATNEYNNGTVQTPVGVQLVPGGNAWQTLSDSTKKERVRLADGNLFLTHIGRMRLGSWNYRGQSADTMRHYGPMAQDFYAAFGHDGVGRIGNPTSINQADFDGVNLIAIQALYRRVQALEADNARLRQQVQQLQAQPGPASSATATATLEALEARLRRLEAAGGGQAQR